MSDEHTSAKLVINNRFQKRNDTYEDILPDDVLTDLVEKVTGQAKYEAEFVDEVNVGRLVVVEYAGVKTFVSLSDDQPAGRNSYFQSFPSALIRYHIDDAQNKRIAFYFLNKKEGTAGIDTAYHHMMYRLMATVGTEFLNGKQFLSEIPKPFESVESFIYTRSTVLKSKQNNSTYVTIDDSGSVNIYAKTYGANKKESTLIVLALNLISSAPVVLYMFNEGSLKELPDLDLTVIEAAGVSVTTTNQALELEEYQRSNSLRSPHYISNLLARIGSKTCALCDCDIPQLIEGAHIFPVASIKRLSGVTDEEKLSMATDGSNGLWLCNNHHKLLDSGFIRFNAQGRVSIVDGKLSVGSIEFVQASITKPELSESVLSEDFINYLARRNSEQQAL